jgi:hypothetical protein
LTINENLLYDHALPDELSRVCLEFLVMSTNPVVQLLMLETGMKALRLYRSILPKTKHTTGRRCVRSTKEAMLVGHFPVITRDLRASLTLC